MELADLIDQVGGFDTTTPREQIKLFAWWLHVHNGKELFGPAEVRTCYAKLHVNEPPALATYLTRMADARPADLLREKGKYKLARQARNELDKSYATHQSIVQVSKLLAELPDKVPDVAEKVFLIEAIDCYRVRAYRACIVMTWNLAFNHLLNWILKDAGRLAAFNDAIPKRYQKRVGVVMKSYDDFFEEFNESEVIEVCNTAATVNSNIIKILKEKLVKRNIAAHPSSIVVVQSQADDVVTDLVNNVVVALA
ncbi:MAG: hypothetical protein QOE55_6236 [Acidobacteriaceae bacterium]|jgi:hypothetical protein|nr:hypothetical protein [Acidobacteriaceae bacterium]